MIHSAHLRTHVVRPVLVSLQLWSPVAEDLLMGTAAQESHLKYLVQLGSGPARGLWQMEPATERDIWESYLRYRKSIRVRLHRLIGADGPNPARLTGDLRYGAAMCRIHYLRVREALPAADDIAGYARYWKTYYNTPAGAGTESEFVHNYKRLLGASPGDRS